MSAASSGGVIPPPPPGGAGRPGPRGSTSERVTDYEQTVGVINMLTDVRFKLAAFVPIVTGAAVALIRANDIGRLNQFVLGVGGLVVVLGIVLYDLRNSQIYNGAIGRAKGLEQHLFERIGDDTRRGLFGSRTDSALVHKRRGTDRFLLLPVNHGTALMLVYTAAFAAWVWVVLDAPAQWASDQRPRARQPVAWLQQDNHASWVAAALAVVAAVGFGSAYRRHDPGGRQERSMIKLTFCLRRRLGMTVAEFQDHWRNTHAPLVAERARVLQIRRYVQVHTADVDGLHRALQSRNGGSPEPYDGVAELWFDTYEALNTTGAKARAARAELLADEQKFIDLANSPLFIGEERDIVWEGTRHRRRRWRPRSR